MSSAGEPFSKWKCFKATAEEYSEVAIKQDADYVPEFDRETVKYLKGES